MDELLHGLIFICTVSGGGISFFSTSHSFALNISLSWNDRVCYDHLMFSV